MEPNQAIQNNQINTARVGNVATTTNTTTTTGTANTTASAPRENMMAKGVNEKKGGKGMVLALIFCLLLAAGGIGFGVWAMMDGNNQKDNYEEQISKLKTQNNELQEQLSEKTEINETIIAEDDKGNGSTTNTTGYIYVGEWGTKIKIPENLKDVSYFVHNWDDGQFAGTSLCVTGATTGHGNQTPSFITSIANGTAMVHGMVCLQKNTKATSDDSLYGPVNEFIVRGPQAMIGNESDGDWELESVNTIKEMLENSENRSAI